MAARSAFTGGTAASEFRPVNYRSAGINQIRTDRFDVRSLGGAARDSSRARVNGSRASIILAGTSPLTRCTRPSTRLNDRLDERLVVTSVISFVGRLDDTIDSIEFLDAGAEMETDRVQRSRRVVRNIPDPCLIRLP